MSDPCIGLSATGGSADAAFSAPELNASICNFSFKLPSLSFGFSLPSLSLVLPKISLPFIIPSFSFSLNCDLSNPIDVSAGLEYGGGRVSCFEPSPDKEE